MTREADGAWHVVLHCDQVPGRVIPKTGQDAGIDLGIRALVSTSDGDQYANPRGARTARSDLAEAQRAVARRKRDSGRQAKADGGVTPSPIASP